MKLLVEKLANTEIGILLRNSFNFKKINLKLFKKDYPTTVSDAFLWRTDNGFKTKFKYSDILDLFYKINNSWVEIHFYNKYNQLIKIKKIDKLEISNEIVITSKYLDNIEDYGIFYIYHFFKDDKNLLDKNIISNRCYLGYSLNNNLYSFVHGNTLVKFTSINKRNRIFTNIVKTSLFKNQIYTIQKYFNDFDKNELFFINPTSKTLNFNLENKDYKLNANCALLIKTTKPLLSIKSNCLFLRPTIFSYKEEFIDVHHS